MAGNIVWVPHGSMLGSLLVNIFPCHLFYFLGGTIIASYADDTTPCNANLTQELVFNELDETSFLFKWFNSNSIKVNCDKSHLFKFGNKAFANIDNNPIESQDMHELPE